MTNIWLLNSEVDPGRNKELRGISECFPKYYCWLSSYESTFSHNSYYIFIVRKSRCNSSNQCRRTYVFPSYVLLTAAAVDVCNYMQPCRHNAFLILTHGHIHTVLHKSYVKKFIIISSNIWIISQIPY